MHNKKSCPSTCFNLTDLNSTWHSEIRNKSCRANLIFVRTSEL
jgi:hypothetical protein